MKNIFLKIVKMIVITTVLYFSLMNFLISEGESLFTKQSWLCLGMVYLFFIIRIIRDSKKPPLESEEKK